MHYLRLLLCLSIVACTACSQDEPPPAPVPESVLSLDSVSEAYVRLALAWGEHDPDYVDAYYGPPEWREQAQQETAPIDALRERTRDLIVELARRHMGGPRIEAQRQVYLLAQLRALNTRMKIVGGAKMQFDAESKDVFGARAPTHDAAHFDALLTALDAALPGKGTTSERYIAFRNKFVIPADKLDAVFKRAIAACRERTLAHIELPPQESFTIEYVRNKPWGGYNWYQGNFHSVIQLNTDLPIFIDRAIDLACHEGYPGHHVYATLLEQRLVRERGWKEFTLSPLFSPSGLLGEGTANYGIELAFPGDERWQFERDELYPLAGLDPKQAERFYRTTRLAAKLDYAVNEAARRYLDGTIDAKAARAWLERYALMSPERAQQRLRFIETYRAYVINYNLGLDLVRQHVEAAVSRDGTTSWEAFEKLLSTPMVPGALGK